MDMSRRSFIVSSTAAAAAGAALAQAQAEAQPAPAQPMPAPMPRGFNPSDPALKYELVIAGGEVLDPSLRLRGKRDIGSRTARSPRWRRASPPIAPSSASTRPA